MSDLQHLYKQRAHYINRDLRNGDLTPEQVTESIESDWEKDEDEYRRSYGARSKSAFMSGVRKLVKIPKGASAPKARAPQRVTALAPHRRRSTKAPLKRLPLRTDKKKHAPAKKRRGRRSSGGFLQTVKDVPPLAWGGAAVAALVLFLAFRAAR